MGILDNHDHSTSGETTIPTAGITANAITQMATASATTSDQSTTSTTPVAITGCSVTFTTTGGNVLILGNAVTSNDTAGKNVAVRLFIDGNSVDANLVNIINSSGIANELQSGSLMYLHTPTAASHTWDLRFVVPSGGTAKINNKLAKIIVIEFKR